MPRLHALAAVCLLASPLLTAADWPQWRGPDRDGVSKEAGLLKEWPQGGPKLAWKAKLGGVGYGSPAVVGERLYVTAAEDDQTGAKEFALCLSTKDGKEVWRKELPVGEGGYSTTWGSGPRGTPTVEGDFLYYLSPRGDLHCLKTADGTRVWGVTLKAFEGGVPYWGYSESVLVDGDKVVCTPGGKQGTVLALDKKTGQKLWQSEEIDDGAAYASLVPIEVGKVRLYVTQTPKAAIGVRASDGKLLFRVGDLKRATAVIPTPVIDGDRVFLTSGYNAGCELLKLEPGADGTVKATVEYTKNPAVVNHHGGVVRVGDHVYGFSDRVNKWVCYEFKKGGEDYAWESDSLGKGCVTAAGGMLYCLGEDPKKGVVVLAEASPAGWKERGRFELPEKSEFPRRLGAIWTHPVVANGKLYLRDHELLFCYDVAAK